MSLFNEEKVPLGRYALRAIPPTSWAPPVHTPRAASRPKSTFLFVDIMDYFKPRALSIASD